MTSQFNKTQVRLLAVLMPLLVCVNVLNGDEAASELVSKSIEYRQQLKSVSIEAKLTNEAPLESEGKLSMTMSVFNNFPDEKFRVDREVTLPDGTLIPREVFCWQCTHPGKMINYQTYDVPGQLPKVIYRDTGEPGMIPKLRLLGMLASGFKELGEHSLEDCNWIEMAREGKVTVVPDALLEMIYGSGRDSGDSTGLKMISFVNESKRVNELDEEEGKTKISGRIVFDTKKGNSVVFSEVEIDLEDMVIVDSARSELQQVDSLWFPKRVVSKRLIDGELSNIEKLVVSSCSINSKADFGTFDAMDIEKGAMVLQAPGFEQGIFQWDGEDIVVLPVDQDYQPVEVARDSTWRRAFVFGNIILFIAIGGFLVRRLLAKK